MADVIFINFEEGVKRVMNNTAFYIKLLNKFKVEDNLKDLDAALAAGDMEKAQGAAHTLKGLSANLSLTELNRQSLEIETQIKAKDVKPDQFNIIRNVYTETITELEKAIAQYGG